MTDPRALAAQIVEAMDLWALVPCEACQTGYRRGDGGMHYDADGQWGVCRKVSERDRAKTAIERVLRAHQDAHPHDSHEHRRPDGDGPLLARNAEHDNAATHEIASQRADVHAPLAASGRRGQPTPEAGSNPADALSLQLAACVQERDRLHRALMGDSRMMAAIADAQTHYRPNVVAELEAERDRLRGALEKVRGYGRALLIGVKGYEDTPAGRACVRHGNEILAALAALPPTSA